jgi:hypothetical protein
MVKLRGQSNIQDLAREDYTRSSSRKPHPFWSEIFAADVQHHGIFSRRSAS